MGCGQMIKTHLSWGDIELNLLTLTFPPKVENIYKEELFKKSLRHVRFALVLSIVFFGGFGIFIFFFLCFPGFGCIYLFSIQMRLKL